MNIKAILAVVLVLVLLSVLCLNAQSVTNLLQSAHVMQMGGADDHLIGVTYGQSNFVWYGFGWTAAGFQQGRCYWSNGAVENIPSARDGVVAGIRGAYSIVVSNGISMFGAGDRYTRIPDLPGKGPSTPVSLNSSGTVVGFSFLNTPFVYSNGVISALSTLNQADGSATAISPTGIIAGHLFPTNGVNTTAVVWENGICALLCTQWIESLAMCATDSRIGGSIGDQACYWEKANGSWNVVFLAHNGAPLQGTVLAIDDSGYLGGTRKSGGAFLGKIGEGNVVNLAGHYGLPSSAQGVVGLAVANGQLAVAVDGADQAWGIVAMLGGEFPRLNVDLLERGLVRVS